MRRGNLRQWGALWSGRGLIIVNLKGEERVSKQGFVKIFIHITGLAMVVNGLWMVARAVEWFFNIPADMLATGDPNGHLIRDVGFAYLVFGAALNWSAFDLRNRRPILLLATAFMVLHALGHSVEILIGLLPASHWWIDFPLVLMPGLIFAGLAVPGIWQALMDESDRST